MNRNARLLLGVGLLAGAVAFFLLGQDANNSLASEASRLIEDTPSDRTIGFMVAAAVCGLAGLAAVASVGWRGKGSA